jgi:trimeric autotransporter adhesin
MSQMTRFRSALGLVLVLCAVLAGCNSRTNVSATGSTPNQFTHVFISAGAVWFNTNASAGPSDSGWAKFPLKTAVTVDLVQQSNGTLGEIANDLRVAPGTYNSILLLPATTAQINDATFIANLAATGATYPQEADFVDTAGNSHQVALVLPNPELGIAIPGASLKVPIGSVGVGAGTTGTTGTTDTFGNSGITSTGTGATTTTGTTSSTQSTTTTVSFGTNFDANRDLHPFCYAVPMTACTQSSSGTTTGTTTGVIFGPRAVASDLSTTGGITGTVTLTLLQNITAVSGRVAIQASAELQNADQSNPHYDIIASAPVQSDGTFTIYPLQSNSATPTVYDVVIHGPNIATIIVKNVAVATTTPSLTGAASTAGSVATTTATGAVSLGTFTPRQSDAFTAQITPNTSSPLPGGAAVVFYQTLPSNQYAYAIDEVGIDPVSGNLQTPELLSLQSIDSGTYSSSGSTITVTSSNPVEGASSYHVAATAPLYTDGTISSAPVVNGTQAQALTTFLPVTVAGLTPADGSTGGAIAASVTESSPGLYTGGELLVSNNGAVVGSASLPSAALLSGSGTVTVSNLPSGTYSLSAILWSGTAFQYESVASSATVSGTTTQVAVPLN